jgi:hypothetical protein
MNGGSPLSIDRVDLRTLSQIEQGELECTAIHEAGHAVAQIILGRDFGKRFQLVAIYPDNIVAPSPDDAFLGKITRSRFDVFWIPSYQQLTPREEWVSRLHGRKTSSASHLNYAMYNMRREFITMMAGPYAEYLRGSENTSHENVMSWFDDWCEIYSGDARDVIAIMDDYRCYKRTPPVKKFTADTHHLVASNFSAITALADALLVQHSMTYDEALSISEPHLNTSIGIRGPKSYTFT